MALSYDQLADLYYNNIFIKRVAFAIMDASFDYANDAGSAHNTWAKTNVIEVPGLPIDYAKQLLHTLVNQQAVIDEGNAISDTDLQFLVNSNYGALSGA